MMKAKPVQIPALLQGKRMPERISVGTEHSAEPPGVKTSGIKIRGTGAATKGTMARGPMA